MNLRLYPFQAQIDWFVIKLLLINQRSMYDCFIDCKIICFPPFLFLHPVLWNHFIFQTLKLAQLQVFGARHFEEILFVWCGMVFNLLDYFYIDEKNKKNSSIETSGAISREFLNLRYCWEVKHISNDISGPQNGPVGPRSPALCYPKGKTKQIYTKYVLN